MFPTLLVSSHSNPEHVGRKEGSREVSGFADEPDDAVSLAGSVAHTDHDGEIVIMSPGPRRVPTGFYTIVHHSGLEWRIEREHVSLGSDALERSVPVSIPSHLSNTIFLAIQASFEFQPTLCDEEQLRNLTISVAQVLDHSENDPPFIFSRYEDAISPCSSLFMAVRRRGREGNNLLALRVLQPCCSFLEPASQLEDTTEQGHVALSRHRRHREIRDLKLAIQQFQHVCSLDHPHRTVAQSNTVMVELIHCRVDNTPSPNIPLSMYCDALAAHAVSHSDRPSTLIQLAVMLFARLEKQEDEARAAEVQAFLREVMHLNSAKSQKNRAAAFMLRVCSQLATALSHTGTQSSVVRNPALGPGSVDPLWVLSTQLLGRFVQFGRLADLQLAISTLEVYINSIPVSDPRYPVGLVNLGTSLWLRYCHTGGLTDLGTTILRLQVGVDLIPDSHPLKHLHLNNLANFLGARFQRLGKLDDLEESISRRRSTVYFIPNGHPAKPWYLSDLVHLLRTRFKRLGQLGDLEESILRQRSAIGLIPNGHSAKPWYLSDLADLLRTRIERLGQLGDLEESSLRQQSATDLIPDNHPHMYCLGKLGYSLRTRSCHLGKLNDLEEAISCYRDAVDLIPDGHPRKLKPLVSLACSLITRFQRQGEPNDLKNAISWHQNAVKFVPDGHVHKSDFLCGLGDSFLVCFERFKAVVDLEEAISRYQDAISLTPDDHPEKSDRLCKLGTLLFRRFECSGELGDLEESITLLRGAADVTPHSHPLKLCRLNNLGIALRTRFHRIGKLADLKETISMHQNAIDLTPTGYPKNPGHMDSLATSFSYRFQRLGELSDLEKAISLHQHAVDLTPRCHPHRSLRLGNLGSCLADRFDYLGELSDLEQAISRQREAIDLSPDGDPYKPLALNNFGNSLRTRFAHLGELNDLEQAILRFKDAIDRVPDSHHFKPEFLSNLGNAFLDRFKHLGELSDLDDAISRQQSALNLTSNTHFHRPVFLNSIGNSLFMRFERLGELESLEEAISRRLGAVALLPDSHPRKPTFLNDISSSFFARFECLGELHNTEHALSLSSQAACSPAGFVFDRFRASQKWISYARHLHHHSLLHAHSVAVSLLPQLAWVGLSLAHRYRQLIQAAGVVHEAAAAALDMGCPETAVEWLEQGRSVVWGALLQLRSSYDELSSAHPDHARRLCELSAALEHAGTTRERTFSSQSEHAPAAENSTAGSLQQIADRHRTLAIEREILLQEIRKLPGFERFLLHKEFSQLRASANSGPVVILNAADTRCDAMIVLADVDHVVHVPLPDFTLEQCRRLQTSMNRLARHARAVPCEDRYGQCAPQHSGSPWRPILASLWRCVVKPVLDALALSTPGETSRIFWCPTGPFTFLPIHAAGLYDAQHLQPGSKIFDFVVSSYIPSLSVLASLPRSGSGSRDDLTLLSVRQPLSDGQVPLPGVNTESEYIRKVIENSPSTQSRLVESSVGTVEEVLGLMKDADWVHFACHGVQDATNPAESGLCLADARRLRVSDITALSRPHGGLAFLSACQTAKGDEDLSDEAIHIAAGMLFAGYGGVVGTMWSISDRIAPDVAKDVYGYLFRSGARPDHRDAARALHEAVARLRDRKVSFEDWLPFIHVGL